MQQRKNATLKIGRRELIAIVAGVLLYGGLAWLTKVSEFSSTVGGDIRPAVVIPILFGFIYGPIVGFATGMFGNFLGDYLLGYLGAYPPPPEWSTGNAVRDVFQVFLLNWQIGNGISGLIPGIMAMYHRKYDGLRELVQAAAYILVAVVVGIGFAMVTDLWVWDATLEASWEASNPIMQHNLVVSLILGLILLYVYSKFSQLELRGTQWLRSGLLQRLTGTVLFSAAVPTLLLGYFLSLTGEVDASFFVKVGSVAVITAFVAVAGATVFAQDTSRPLLRLTDAANDMRAGRLTLERAAELQTTEASDEIGQLSQMFGQMAVQVIEREASLKRQVEALRIEIDQVKQSKQVAEITDNEFFRDLQSKAKYLRNRDRAGLDAFNAQISANMAASKAETDATTEETHGPMSSNIIDAADGTPDSEAKIGE